LGVGTFNGRNAELGRQHRFPGVKQRERIAPTDQRGVYGKLRDT